MLGELEARSITGVEASEDRRTDRRNRASTEIRLWCLDRSGNWRALTAPLANFSAGGLAVRLPQPIPPDEFVLAMWGLSARKASVCYCRKDGPDFLVGLSF